MTGVLFELDASPGGDRILAQESDGVVRLWSVAGGVGRALETLPSRHTCGGFLPDGRIVVGFGAAQGSLELLGAARIHVYSPDGQLERTVDLGRGEVSCVVDGSALLVAVDPRPSPQQEHQQLWLVDADDGTARALDPRLRLLEPQRGIIAPPAAHRLLVSDSDGGLVEWDRAAAQARTLLAGRAR